MEARRGGAGKAIMFSVSCCTNVRSRNVAKSERVLPHHSVALVFGNRHTLMRGGHSFSGANLR